MRLLGRDFVPVSGSDWDGYAGAEPGTLISRGEDCDLLFDPKTGVLSEMLVERNSRGEEAYCQRDWTSTQILGTEGQFSELIWHDTFSAEDEHSQPIDLYDSQVGWWWRFCLGERRDEDLNGPYPTMNAAAQAAVEFCNF